MIALNVIAIVMSVLVATTTGAGSEFRFKTSAFKASGTIPHQYSYNGNGCDGRNLSPEFHWSGAPSGTQAFALTMFDPDAGNGVGWWHWVVFNIPAETTQLATGAGSAHGALMPKGAVQGRNDFQTVGYGGPCPPPGTPHHYRFTLYALDQHLDGLSPLTSGPTLLNAIRGHILAASQVTGLFGR